MKRGYFVIILLALIGLPTIVFAQEQGSLDRFEFGVYGGLGMYVGPNEAAKGILQVPRYIQNEDNYKNPGIETFGFSVGYRYDLRWQFKLQATRQRMGFDEVTNPINNHKYLYYNAMWHLDAMAEFNILRFGPEMRPGQSVYNVVPFVGLGYGLTFYNENATLRTKRDGLGDIGAKYPRVGRNLLQDDKGKFTIAEKANTNLAMYIPMALGVKWRINHNVQIKGTFQYHLYFQNPDKSDKIADWTPKINSNICGGTLNTSGDKIYGGVVGSHHDFMLSLGVVVNFGVWLEDLAKKNVNF